MRVNRALEIVTILLGRDVVPARELAERFEVSVRTIYRDIDALSEAGVPVYMRKGKGGGISLMEGYAMDRTLITDDEARDLLLALQTLRATNLPGSDFLLEKLTALLSRGAPENWVEIDFSGWSDLEKDRDKFELIKTGILTRQVLEIEYMGASGQRTTREIWPLRLRYKSRAWYLVAYCTRRQADRIFRVSRIVGIRPVARHFPPRPVAEDPDTAPSPMPPMTAIRLKFTRDVLYRLYDEFAPDAIVFLPDGGVEVEVCFPEDEWVYSFLLSFGPSVEVLEPPALRDKLRERLERTVAQYKKDPRTG